VVPIRYSCTYSGFGTKLLDRGWTLSYSEVANGERLRAGVGILTRSQLGASVLEFSPVSERVASLRLRVTGGKLLTFVFEYSPNSSSNYPAVLESLCGVLDWVSPWAFHCSSGRLSDRPGKPKRVVRN